MKGKINLMLNAALIGFGGIAQAHKKGYDLLEKEGKGNTLKSYS